jgi:hypothetical protein
MMMMTTNKPHPANKTNQRWYQKDKDLLTLVGKLKKMPVSLMETYCHCIITYAMELYQTDEKKRHFIEAGSDKHQSLMKSLDKKRWCDQNPYSYSAFNALYLMEGMHRKELVLNLLETQALLHAYNQRCLQYHCQPNLSVVEHLLLVFVKQGEQEALVELSLLETQDKLGQPLEKIN